MTWNYVDCDWLNGLPRWIPPIRRNEEALHCAHLSIKTILTAFNYRHQERQRWQDVDKQPGAAIAEARYVCAYVRNSDWRAVTDEELISGLTKPLHLQGRQQWRYEAGRTSYHFHGKPCVIQVGHHRGSCFKK